MVLLDGVAAGLLGATGWLGCSIRSGDWLIWVACDCGIMGVVIPMNPIGGCVGTADICGCIFPIPNMLEYCDDEDDDAEVCWGCRPDNIEVAGADDIWPMAVGPGWAYKLDWKKGEQMCSGTPFGFHFW